MNVGLMVAGIGLLLMQMHGRLHQSQVDDLSFSKDSNAHDHRTQDAAAATPVPTAAAPTASLSQAEFSSMAETWLRAKQDELRRQQEGAAHGHAH